ncbi:UxaA family hydrolase [Desulfovibrio piger]|nr:UxaA family hydrolase [Desulfovibrio piger]
MKQLLALHDMDNVGNVLEDVKAGDGVCWSVGDSMFSARALEDIPFGFKMALRAVPKGEPIIKYGNPIGFAERDIAAGELVHVHNVAGGRGRGDLERKEG